jgi:hypothetical protein
VRELGTATRKATRKHAVIAWGAGTPDERIATRLIHSHCHRRVISGHGNVTQRFRQPKRLQGLLEPWCGESSHARLYVESLVMLRMLPTGRDSPV